MAFQWDFLKSHVDPTALREGGQETGRAGNFISSESVLLAAGPASLGTATSNFLDQLYPIGVCDTISIATSKNVLQLYEIGSRIPYLIPGRPVTQFQISRVVFNGDSLLGALTKGNDIVAEDYQGTVMGLPGADFSIGGNSDQQGKFYLNLASHFFNNPFGLAVFYQDSEEQWVAGYYAENCVIQNHQMQIQGQNMIIMETALVRCVSFVPLPTTATS